MNTVSELVLQTTSYVLMLLFLGIIIPLHLFTCFLAGFLAYEIIISLTPGFERIVGISSARWVIVTMIAIFVVITMTWGIVRLLSILTIDTQGGIDIIAEIDRICSIVNNRIPDFLSPFILPNSAEEFKVKLLNLIESNIVMIRNMGSKFLHGIITAFIGMTIGSVISLNKPAGNSTYFTLQLIARLNYLAEAFRHVVLAQIKVSLFNTLLTSIMMFIVFPYLNINLPLGKTLIILTFIFGLLPIIGNLISNLMIIISALSVSITVGGFMLLYLIFIHKLEYFINAEIVGSRIHAKSWELLLAMLISEAAFGLEGLVAGPIYYAYIKTELRARELI
ncbi:AI-2E family transporter [Candidatus Palibaumannia cicadellinicola]|uniref:AI-2E family transporter n=1 Tax=Baumannia cicadellinicola subsp. Homalodisca coagulata TaxID=374463 RepID=Q1LTW5_BAUCH|nr:AI-2E family transporter [Candidatus Baumannia cicadellinicola]ABF13943.1 conserved hypothetical protein [Baumannia cicadellinicola str. Hc (Homalodisca coagulata)]MCJ7462420.1 AI-2E family transporter [Candidatus Baumannia cicadellinicola]MCJ7463048.1 AI-2E family transporter [Candidatus Baumannia cicadellinicola]